MLFDLKFPQGLSIRYRPPFYFLLVLVRRPICLSIFFPVILLVDRSFCTPIEPPPSLAKAQRYIVHTNYYLPQTRISPQEDLPSPLSNSILSLLRNVHILSNRLHGNLHRHGTIGEVSACIMDDITPRFIDKVRITYA